MQNYLKKQMCSTSTIAHLKYPSITTSNFYSFKSICILW